MINHLAYIAPAGRSASATSSSAAPGQRQPTLFAYSTGRPIRVGDVVKRGPRAKATYLVDKLYMSGNQPVIGLAPYSGYTAFGVEEIARLELLDPAYLRPTTRTGNTEENTREENNHE